MKHNSSGFAHLILVVIAVIVIVGGVGAYVVTKQDSNDSGQSNNISNTPENTPTQSAHAGHNMGVEPAIELQNIGIDTIDNVDITQNAVREFTSNSFKGFYAFGDTLGGGGSRQNPNFEFSSLKSGTRAIAAIDGVIAFIQEQTDSNDYEVFLQPKENSMWTIGYDHLTNITVKKGDTVQAGDVLGEPATQQNGALRFEIQINKDENGQTTHICPTTLLSDSVAATIESHLKTMMQSWETTTGLDLYDIDAQKPAGCLVQTLTPAQAEGR